MSFALEVRGHLTGPDEEAGPRETDILGRFLAVIEAVEVAYPGAITSAEFTGQYTGHVVLAEVPMPPKGKGGRGGNA